MTRPVRLLFSKWGDHPHWELAGQLLGEDDHGAWFAVPKGTVMTRPGMRVETHYRAVVLAPRAKPFVAMFMDRAPSSEDHNPPVVYVDMTTVPVIGTAAVTAVDLDLDVLRLHDGTVVVDDEEEFLAHQQQYGYPPGVIELAERSCRDVVEGMTAHRPPWGAESALWLAAVPRV